MLRLNGVLGVERVVYLQYAEESVSSICGRIVDELFAELMSNTDKLLCSIGLCPQYVVDFVDVIASFFVLPAMLSWGWR